jgi:hypothetical protein
MEPTAQNVAKAGLEMFGQATFNGTQLNAANLVVQLLTGIADGSLTVGETPKEEETGIIETPEAA